MSLFGAELSIKEIILSIIMCIGGFRFLTNASLFFIIKERLAFRAKSILGFLLYIVPGKHICRYFNLNHTASLKLQFNSSPMKRNGVYLMNLLSAFQRDGYLYFLSPFEAFVDSYEFLYFFF